MFFSWHRNSNAIIGYRRSCETGESFSSKIPLKYSCVYPPVNLNGDVRVEVNHSCVEISGCGPEGRCFEQRIVVPLLGAQARFGSTTTLDIYANLDSQSIWKYSYEISQEDTHGSGARYAADTGSSAAYPQPRIRIPSYVSMRTRPLKEMNFSFAVKCAGACRSPPLMC